MVYSWILRLKASSTSSGTDPHTWFVCLLSVCLFVCFFLCSFIYLCVCWFGFWVWDLWLRIECSGCRVQSLESRVIGVSRLGFITEGYRGTSGLGFRIEGYRGVEGYRVTSLMRNCPPS